MFAKYERELANRHYQLFLACLAVMFLHLTEDALVHKENGSSVAAQLGATAFNVVLVAIGAGLYPLLWRWARRARCSSSPSGCSRSPAVGVLMRPISSPAMLQEATTPGASTRSRASC